MTHDNHIVQFERFSAVEIGPEPLEVAVAEQLHRPTARGGLDKPSPGLLEGFHDARQLQDASAGLLIVS